MKQSSPVMELATSQDPDTRSKATVTGRRRYIL